MSESLNESKSPAQPEMQVPMRAVVTFVRQLSHDLRNHLNAAELQSAFLGELAETAEQKSEMQRLRGMLSEMSVSLHRLTNSLAAIKLTRMPYEAEAFLQDLGEKLARQFPEQSREIDWKIQTGETLLDIDPQLLQEAFLELFANAFQHGRDSGRFIASAEVDGQFTFTLREPKKELVGSPENWGREPFGQVRHGHYGLGLHRARHIIEAHAGRVCMRYDEASSSLVTIVSLPLAEAK